ncbi:hypothetical protein Sarmat_00657 [Rickettsiales endosymbiont of Paramecium tredecaurelia]|uniref:hypothetical protein n=1 Tax=Candidatus Sarmatiella mevalonica TaxID=2770581 RepID=UPI0019228C13|nr:hypothetical protein [Candidatus Sarmatiella mevalonica]MBL3284800.1 hypothetical protein [Candidatus Sarmatiella mevalonica]
MQSTPNITNPYVRPLQSMSRGSKQNASQINQLQNQQPKDQSDNPTDSYIQLSETNKADQVGELQFTEKYPNPGIRSVESMRNAALCYYLMYEIDNALQEGSKDNACAYFSYLEDITRDRVQRITQGPSRPDGVFAYRLGRYRQILNNPQVKVEYAKEVQIEVEYAREVKQALNAFSEGDYETLQKLRKPHTVYGKQVADIEMLCITETMMLLWGRSYDELTPEEALKLYTLWAVDLLRDDILNFNAFSMSLMRLFLENQSDKYAQDAGIVYQYMNNYAREDSAVAAWCEPRADQMIACYNISTELVKYLALVHRDYDGVNQDILNQIEPASENIGYDLLSELYYRAFVHETGVEWQRYVFDAKCDIMFGADYKALEGLCARHPYDSEVQKAKNDLKEKYSDCETNPALYRDERLQAWDEARLQAQLQQQRRQEQQMQQPMKQEQMHRNNAWVESEMYYQPDVKHTQSEINQSVFQQNQFQQREYTQPQAQQLQRDQCQIQQQQKEHDKPQIQQQQQQGQQQGQFFTSAPYSKGIEEQERMALEKQKLAQAQIELFIKHTPYTRARSKTS